MGAMYELTASGNRLETRRFDRRLDWRALRATRWAAGGIPSATRTVEAGRNYRAVIGTMYGLKASGIRLEIQEMDLLAGMIQDIPLPRQVARMHRTPAPFTGDSI